MKEIRKCPICSLYYQTSLHVRSNPKVSQENKTWKIYVLYLVEFGKLLYVHHNINACSGLQWATALNTKKADSAVPHILAAMVILRILVQIKTDNAPVYVSTKIKQCFKYYKFKYIIGIPQNTTAQAVKERSNLTLKIYLLNKKS